MSIFSFLAFSILGLDPKEAITIGEAIIDRRVEQS
jgi:hypothetical protein